MAKYDYSQEGVNEVGQDVSSIQQTLHDHFASLNQAVQPLVSAQAWKGTGQEDFAQDMQKLTQQYNNLDTAVQSFLTALSVIRDQSDQTIQSCTNIVNNIDVAAV
jgi:uncharacterized protein YukE